MGMRVMYIKPIKLLLKSINLLITLFICTLLITTVSAHGGRTDANGGHYNHSTGEYHYHHGYSAHQHPGGVCPYSYDDQTDHSSSSDSYGNSYSSNKYNSSYSSGNYNSSSGSSSSSYHSSFYDSNNSTYSKYNKTKNTSLPVGEKVKYLALLAIIIAGICFVLYKYIKTKVCNSLKAFKLFRNNIIPIAIAISIIISGFFYSFDPDMVLILSNKEIIEVWILWIYVIIILCIFEFALITYTVYINFKDKEHYQHVTVDDIRNNRVDRVIRRFAMLKLFKCFLLPFSIIISIGMSIFFNSAHPDMVLILSDHEIAEAWMAWIYIAVILGITELILFAYKE